MSFTFIRSLAVFWGMFLFALWAGGQGLAGRALAADRPFRAGDLPPGTRVQRDVAYGPAPLQKLDIYSPSNAKNAPVILMVHGGGWWRGDKAAVNVVKNKVDHWVPQGYAIISVNYRLLPDANPVQQAEDVARAMAYAQQHAKSWGGDPSRFILMGHSAGAHLVCLLAADPSIAHRQGARDWLGTVCLDSAAYNVVKIMNMRHFRLYDQAFGKDPRFWKEASPTLRLSSAPNPMLLVCSSRRRDSLAAAHALADKARSLGGRITILPEDMGHGPINSELGLPGAYTDQVDAFIHSLSRKK